MKQPSIFDDIIAPAPRYMMRLECVQRLVDTSIPTVSRFLEVGAGFGDVSAFLIKRFPNSKGEIVEFSEAAAVQIRARFKDSAQLNVTCADIMTLDDRNSISLILAFEVLEHIEHDSKALSKIFAMLDKKGYFLMSVPAFMSKWQKVDEWAGHFRRYEMNELKNKLEAAGFTILHMSTYGFPITGLLYPFRQFYYRQNRSELDTNAKINATKRSGIDRPLKAPKLSRWLSYALRPAFILQRATKDTSWGDGWIVLAQKP